MYNNLELGNFVKNKAIIRRDGFGDKIDRHYFCINTKGEVLFDLAPDMYCFAYENEDVAKLTYNNSIGNFKNINKYSIRLKKQNSNKSEFFNYPSSMPVKNLTEELINAGLYKAYHYETAKENELWHLTSFSQSKTGLAMKIYLRCIPNKGEPPFLRFQNDRESHITYNWIKMYIDGTLDNYENKTIIFSPEEMQALKNWIKLNKDLITMHYYQEYDSLVDE